MPGLDAGEIESNQASRSVRTEGIIACRRPRRPLEGGGMPGRDSVCSNRYTVSVSLMWPCRSRCWVQSEGMPGPCKPFRWNSR